MARRHQEVPFGISSTLLPPTPRRPAKALITPAVKNTGLHSDLAASMPGRAPMASHGRLGAVAVGPAALAVLLTDVAVDMDATVVTTVTRATPLATMRISTTSLLPPPLPKPTWSKASQRKTQRRPTALLRCVMLTTSTPIRRSKHHGPPLRTDVMDAAAVEEVLEALGVGDGVGLVATLITPIKVSHSEGRLPCGITHLSDRQSATTSSKTVPP